MVRGTCLERLPHHAVRRRQRRGSGRHEAHGGVHPARSNRGSRTGGRCVRSPRHCLPRPRVPAAPWGPGALGSGWRAKAAFCGAGGARWPVASSERWLGATFYLQATCRAFTMTSAAPRSPWRMTARTAPTRKTRSRQRPTSFAQTTPRWPRSVVSALPSAALHFCGPARRRFFSHA